MHTYIDLLLFALDLIIKLLQKQQITMTMITGKYFIKNFHSGLKFKLKEILTKYFQLISANKMF